MVMAKYPWYDPIGNLGDAIGSTAAWGQSGIEWGVEQGEGLAGWGVSGVDYWTGLPGATVEKNLKSAKAGIYGGGPLEGLLDIGTTAKLGLLLGGILIIVAGVAYFKPARTAKAAVSEKREEKKIEKAAAKAIDTPPGETTAPKPKETPAAKKVETVIDDKKKK